jgi:hypothetical protein
MDEEACNSPIGPVTERIVKLVDLHLPGFSRPQYEVLWGGKFRIVGEAKDDVPIADGCRVPDPDRTGKA